MGFWPFPNNGPTKCNKVSIQAKFGLHSLNAEKICFPATAWLNTACCSSRRTDVFVTGMTCNGGRCHMQAMFIEILFHYFDYFIIFNILVILIKWKHDLTWPIILLILIKWKHELHDLTWPIFLIILIKWKLPFLFCAN